MIADGPEPVATAEHLARMGRVAEAVSLLVPLADGAAPSHRLLSVLSTLCKAIGRYDAALIADRKATTLYPESGVAWHNLAATLGDTGQAAEARYAAERALAAQLDAPETWLVYARALLLLSELGAAEKAFRQALRRRPSYVDAAVELARLIWMHSGNVDAAVAPLDAAWHAGAAETPVVLARARLFKAGGAEREARATLEAALQRRPDDVLLLLAVAQAALEGGDVDYGASLASRAEALAPDDVSAKLSLVSLLLAQGDGERALVRARRAIELEPDNQAAWGWLATAARATGEPIYRRLYDYDRFVRSFELAAPHGWGREAWLRDLAAALRRLHPLSFHQPEQTVRGGVQTMIELSTLDDPVIQTFFVAIESPIRSYLSTVGEDPSHPLIRRNTQRYRLSGSWSVLLRPHGYHVDHFHPRGWISSAFYVEVPEGALGSETREGWIRFGQPPFRTVPPMEAEHFVRPAPGRLVLFPSYMWHGTVPFTTPESRLTIAFDAVPA